MRKASLDLQLDLPLAATSGDQLALPLFDSPLPYRLRHGAGGSIRVRVEDGILEVIAPHGTQLRAIETAVRDRGATAVLPPTHLPLLPRVWCDGTTFPFLGGQVNLRLTGAAETGLAGTSLELALPPDASPVQIRDSVHGWLQTQVQVVINQLTAGRARFPRWALSFSRSSLTTVDPDGCVRLNWRLVLLSRDTIAQVLDQASARDSKMEAQTDLLLE
jgi:predicted metal-dependent hydrolase